MRVVWVQRRTGPLADLYVGVVPQNHRIHDNFDDNCGAAIFQVGVLPHPAKLPLLRVDKRRSSMSVPDNRQIQLNFQEKRGGDRKRKVALSKGS